MEGNFKPRVKVGIVGLGNCASALIQGLHHYNSDSCQNESGGLFHQTMNGYAPGAIECVAAFDVDRRKVGLPLNQAIFSDPNCLKTICRDIPESSVKVTMGRVLDGVASHMTAGDFPKGFEVADQSEPEIAEVARVLKDSGAEVLVNFLPVGSQKATEFYMEAALEAGVGVVNCIPVFIASNQAWGQRFAQAGLPLLGDDIKSQLGATVIHRTLADLFMMRGVPLDQTYQLNVGGNTDFLNMLDRNRLASKKQSKTKAVQSVLDKELEPNNIHVGPSDFVPWLDDKKVCFLRMQGRLFGNATVNMEIRLEVEDSPNSAGVVVDAVRACKIAMDRNIGGPIEDLCAYLFKHPPVQHPDRIAFNLFLDFVDQD